MSSISDLTHLDEQDPQAQLIEFMQNYYDNNYFYFKIKNIKDYVHQKVWSLHFDEIYDLVYIFIANIEISSAVDKTKQVIEKEVDPCKKKHMNFSNLAKMTQQFTYMTNGIAVDNIQLKKSHLDRLHGDLNALHNLTDIECLFTLKMQIWSLDDRVITSQNTYSPKPSFEKIILKTNEILDGPYNKFQIMQLLYNKYMDHAQIMQFEGKVFFFKDYYNIRIYDTMNRSCLLKPIKVFKHSKQKTFKSVFHLKDNAKNTQVVDKLLIFSYDHVKTSDYDENEIHDHDNNYDVNGELQEKCSKSLLQKLTILFIDFEDFSENMQRITSQELLIDDDKLMHYYEEEVHTRKMKSMFIQRIDDSQTYIILFPTGLIYTVGINPFIIQSKFQLTLKKDENIIDYQYSISEDGKYHCIWILDEKLQVWKCHNECNPNQVVWTLSRAAIFSKLEFPNFFQQATTYDEFYMTSFLKDIQCYQKKNKQETLSEYLVAFNGTANKVLIIQQPIVPLIKVCPHDFDENNMKLLMNTFGMSEQQLLGNQIKIQLISQQQPIIMNHIRQKRDQVRANIMKNSALHSKKTTMQLKDQISDQLLEKYSANLMKKTEENEILELQYLRQVQLKLPGKHQKQSFQQFLVRRMRSLQIMFTNGLSYWAVDIPRSQTTSPYVIQDILLSQDNKTLVDYCSIPGYPHKSFYRVFKYEKEANSFRINKEQQVNVCTQHLNNMSLDKDGKVQYIKIDLTNDKIKTNFRQHIKFIRKEAEIILQIPKSIIFKELINSANGISKIMTSDDGRIFMCNSLIIQLKKDQSAIQDIGCITVQRSHQIIQYKFMSLLDDEPRKKINQIIKKISDIQSQIVRFDITNEPLTIQNDIDVLYFTNEIIDPQQNSMVQGTSIIKMSLETLQCFEIYRSNLRIVHFAKFDQEDQEDDNTRDQADESDDLSQIIDQQEIKQDLNIIKEKGIDVDADENDKNKKLLAFLAQQLGAHDETVGQKSSITSDEGNANFMVSGKVNPQPADGPFEKEDKQGIEMRFKDIKLTENEDGSLRDALMHMSSGSSPVQDTHPRKSIKRESGVRQSALNLQRSQSANKNIYISLVSQTKTQIKIEIILDVNQKNQSQNNIKSSLKRVQTLKTDTHGCVSKKQADFYQSQKAKLIHCLNMSQDKELTTDSEVGWINENQFILTIDNEYYICNINQNFMQSINDGISYGKQQVNIGKFVSIVSQDYKTSMMRRPSTKVNGSFNNVNFKNVSQNNHVLIEAQEVIQRMEIASLIRYAFILKAQNSQGIEKQLLFFIPCEELKGGSIFSRLSFNYKVIQPYIEKIDQEFIMILNKRVRNIMNYLNKSIVQGKIIPIKIKKSLGGENDEKNQAVSSQKIHVHMFQEDIAGQNAIDNAFDKNSIFCIKAFVDSLLALTSANEMQFTNCFDKALLLMINKGMDVKELVQSSILYPTIWNNQTIFSGNKEIQIIPYNNSSEELEFENPKELFAKVIDSDIKNDKNQSSMIVSNTFSGGLQQISANQEEQHEMQFNYLDLHLIQGDDVLGVAQSLSESQDLRLFEMEAVQVIIDYKWDTYGRKWFMSQLVIYLTFLIFFYIDMQTMHESESLHQPRVKDFQFMLNKTVCITIQMMFMVYEFSQFYNTEPRISYFADSKNYLPIFSVIFYLSASINDILQERVSDWTKIVYVMSTLMSLANVLLLIRVFKQLSFLVIMMTKVVKDLVFFLILFSFFIFTFAACYQIVLVDGSSYGRIPNLFAMFIATMRSAFGDFSLIHPWEGFDIKIVDEYSDEPHYMHSKLIVMFTFVIFIVQSLTLFMIFMNFIIAVIGDSYATVIKFSDAHDYKQRIGMIKEREMYFTSSQLSDLDYFPKILIVRKKKNTLTDRNNIQNQIKTIKDFVRETSQQSVSLINEKSKEQKEHQNNSFKKLENDLHGIKSDIQAVMSEFKQLSKTQEQQSKQQLQMAKILAKINKRDALDNLSESSLNRDTQDIEVVSIKSEHKNSVKLMPNKSPQPFTDSDMSNNQTRVQNFQVQAEPLTSKTTHPTPLNKFSYNETQHFGTQMSLYEAQQKQEELAQQTCLVNTMNYNLAQVQNENQQLKKYIQGMQNQILLRQQVQQMPNIPKSIPSRFKVPTTPSDRNREMHNMVDQQINSLSELYQLNNNTSVQRRSQTPVDKSSGVKSAYFSKMIIHNGSPKVKKLTKKRTLPKFDKEYWR